HRARSGRWGASLRGVLHDQSRRPRHRLVDQPLDRRGARWAALGGPQRASWGSLRVLAPGCGERTIMSGFVVYSALAKVGLRPAVIPESQLTPRVSQTAARVP